MARLKFKRFKWCLEFFSVSVTDETGETETYDFDRIFSRGEFIRKNKKKTRITDIKI